MKRPVSIGFALMLAACGGAEDGVDATLLEGFEPPAPSDGEIQILSPIVEGIPAGGDVTYCTYLDHYFEEQLDVLGFEAYQSASGHHAILYSVPDAQPLGTHDCTEDDMVNVRFLSATAGEGSNFTLPEGLGFRVAAGTQLMIQHHWINPSDQPLAGQAAFNVKLQPPSDQIQIADLFTAARTQIDIAARSDGAARTECVMGADLQVYGLGGHAHEWGTSVKLTRTPAAGGDAEELWNAPEWTKDMVFDAQFTTYSVGDPLLLQQGDLLAVDCTYHNDTDAPIRFPREMCVGFALYFPADRQIDCTDGRWPAD